MAKSGNKRSLQRTDYSLTKELASAICKKIESGQPLFTAEQWRDKIPTVFNVNGEEVRLLPWTYASWIKRNNCPIDGRMTLKTLVAEARYRRFLKEHEDEKKEMVRDAQKYHRKLMALPIGIKTKKTSTKSGYNDRDGDYHEKSEEVIDTPINPQMVAQKRQGSEFVLKSLDASYTEKHETKNTTLHVSLKDLRKMKEEDDRKKAEGQPVVHEHE